MYTPKNKKDDFKNIPVSASLLHIKQHANIIKSKERVRRSASDSNKIIYLPSHKNELQYQ